MKDSIEKASGIRSGFLGAETDAYRLFDGAGDGRAGLFIDNFAGHWLVETLESDLPVELREGGIGGFRSIWWKRLERAGPRPPEWIRGEHPRGRFEVRENGCRFLVDFEAGRSQGLFLDQRLNRARVMERAGRQSAILNCFAYTCGFSVVAAAAGARTTSVDLSEPYLAWGRDNFGLNGLNAGEHEFVRSGVSEALKRFARQGRSFHGVILDPPTFSRDGGRVFRVERDFRELAARAARLVEPGGWMLCCSNCRTLGAGALERELKAALGDAGRGPGGMLALRMPPEYRGEKYLKSFWIEGVT